MKILSKVNCADIYSQSPLCERAFFILEVKIRLDHIAYRVASRHKTSKFFQEAFGYRIQTEFDLIFPDGSCTKCIALEPPEKPKKHQYWELIHSMNDESVSYHIAPEIFVSDGDEESIVGKWVAARSGIGGIHHIAYQVDDVAKKMKEWQEKGYAEFSSKEPLNCPGLTQVFTKPSELTGVIYEFISRGEHGFCAENVQGLMESTKEFK